MEPSSVDYSKPVYSPSKEEKELAPRKAEPPSNDQEETVFPNSSLLEKYQRNLENASQVKKRVDQAEGQILEEAGPEDSSDAQQYLEIELGKTGPLAGIEVPVSKKSKLAHEENISSYQEDRSQVIRNILGDWMKEGEAPSSQKLKQVILDLAMGVEPRYPPCSLEETCRQFIEVGSSIPNAQKNLSILENPNLFSFQELKTGQVPSASRVSVGDSIYQLKKGKLCKPPNNSTEILPRLFQARNLCLHNIRTVYDTMCQEIDHKINHSVCTKYFPSTVCWWVGTANDAIVQEMVKFGEKLGITVLNHQQNQQCNENKISFYSKCTQMFPQDYLEPSTYDIRLLAMPQEGMPRNYQEIIHQSRQERDSNLWGNVNDKNPPLASIVSIGTHWGSHDDDNLKLRTACLPLELASLCQVSVSMNLTYSEGGNVVWTERNGLPHALIGIDSFAFSKVILEKQLEAALTDEEIGMAFAIDYGLKTENITFVEQPGDFHLDMSMIAVGPSALIVNDSLAALQIELQAQLRTFRLQDGELDRILIAVQNIITEERERRVDCTNIFLHFRGIRNQDAVPVIEEEDEEEEEDDEEIDDDMLEMFGFESNRIQTGEAILIAAESSRNAIIRNRLELRTQLNMEEAGFTVERLPGRFYESNEFGQQTEVANFFNAVTASNGQGKLVVMNGCDDVFRPHMDQVKTKFRIYNPEIEFAELSSLYAKNCLKQRGGVSCITKNFSKD